MYKFLGGFFLGLVIGLFFAMVSAVISEASMRKYMQVQAVEAGVAHWSVDTKSQVTFHYNTK
jgi:hypothetical protein